MLRTLCVSFIVFALAAHILGPNFRIRVPRRRSPSFKSDVFDLLAASVALLIATDVAVFIFLSFTAPEIVAVVINAVIFFVIRFIVGVMLD
jgi:hypothetical protein